MCEQNAFELLLIISLIFAVQLLNLTWIKFWISLKTLFFDQWFSFCHEILLSTLKNSVTTLDRQQRSLDSDAARGSSIFSRCFYFCIMPTLKMSKCDKINSQWRIRNLRNTCGKNEGGLLADIFSFATWRYTRTNPIKDS